MLTETTRHNSLIGGVVLVCLVFVFLGGMATYQGTHSPVTVTASTTLWAVETISQTSRSEACAIYPVYNSTTTLSYGPSTEAGFYLAIPDYSNFIKLSKVWNSTVYVYDYSGGSILFFWLPPENTHAYSIIFVCGGN